MSIHDYNEVDILYTLMSYVNVSSHRICIIRLLTRF